MELELGVKLTRPADDSISEFQIAKDRAGPVFLSRETDASFILTAHLKGYKRTNINIDINQDGTLIAISGERQVKETVLVGWKVVKKDTETKGFKKVYRIPDGVILDKIKARFNEDESILTISMPKKVKGIRGMAIEEVKEKEELVREEGSGNLQIVDENVSRNENLNKGKEEITEIVHETKDGIQEMPKEEPKDEEIQERVEPKHDQEIRRDESLVIKQDDFQEISDEKVDEIREEEKEEEEKEKEVKEEMEAREKRSKILCTPIVAGSALLLSLVVFVIQIIRSKNQNSRRKD